MSYTVVIATRQVQRNNGTVRNTIEQAQVLRENGFRVVLMTEKFHENYASYFDEVVKTVRWPIKGYFRRKWFDYLVQRWVRKNKPDMQISHGDTQSKDIIALHNCIRLAHEKIQGCPVDERNDVARFHDRVLETSGAATIIANSNMMRDDLVHRYGVDIKRIVTIYPGYAPEMFSVSDSLEMRREGRKKLGVSESTSLVGLVTSGDFTKRNVGFFLKVAAAAGKVTGHQLHFLVVGADRSLHDYRRLAADLGIAQQVSFAKPMADVHLLYHALDVFVLPAKFEEFGRVVLEALACGTPAVVSDQVGASEIMVEHGLPHVIAGYEAETWVDAIVNLLENPELRERVSAQSADVARLYTREKQMEQFRQVVNSVISRQV